MRVIIPGERCVVTDRLRRQPGEPTLQPCSPGLPLIEFYRAVTHLLPWWYRSGMPRPAASLMPPLELSERLLTGGWPCV